MHQNKLLHYTSSWAVCQVAFPRTTRSVCERICWQAQAARWAFQQVCHRWLRQRPLRAISDSALSWSHRIPEPFRRSVNVPHRDSVGPEPGGGVPGHVLRPRRRQPGLPRFSKGPEQFTMECGGSWRGGQSCPPRSAAPGSRGGQDCPPRNVLQTSVNCSRPPHGLAGTPRRSAAPTLPQPLGDRLTCPSRRSSPWPLWRRRSWGTR